jgi:lipooligosaccharide transport system permease protein
MPAVAALRPLLLVERNVMIYRHTWPLLVAEIFEPLLWFLAFGVGIGELLGQVPGLSGVRYAEFVAPALLATAAMNAAMYETSFTMYGKLRVDRAYDSILTTPLSVRDIGLGEVVWAMLRGAVVSISFLLIVTLGGLTRSPGALLVIPGALLVGFAFASAGLLVATWLRDWQDFQLVQLVMLPMFLFATTFYPLGVYPRPVQYVIACLPLYQSIELLREPFLGHVGSALLVPACYLAIFGVTALLLALRPLARILRY